MRLWHAFRARLHSVLFRRHRESDLSEEFASHLDYETDRLQATGMSPEAARRLALRTFGGIESTKERCRDARGTSLVDALARDVRFTWRSVCRAPLAPVTIVATIAVGLGLVTVVVTALTAFVFRADDVRDPHELFGVTRHAPGTSGSDVMARQDYDALVRETTVFASAFAMTPDVDAWIEGVRREGRLVTGNFFEVLGVSAVRGRALTPGDDEPGRPPVMVISHRSWSRHYASDPGILNRSIRVYGTTFRIIGVMPDTFRGLDIAAPDFWAPLALQHEFRGAGPNSAIPDSVMVIGRLAPGQTKAHALAQLMSWDSSRRSAVGQPRAERLDLEPRKGTIPLSMDTLQLFVPVFFAFGLILLIACANAANLLLARGVARQREIGIRMALGASRRRVVGQLLIENLLLALLSAGLALGVSRLVLETIVYVVIATFPPGLGNLRLEVPPADWRVALFLVVAAFISTLLFALAPALQVTRVALVRAIRGELVADARPGRSRSLLVALQVTGSALLLICAAIFLRSSLAATTTGSGIRISGIVTARVIDEQRRRTLLDVVAAEPMVGAMAAAWPNVLGGLPAHTDSATGKLAVSYQFVSPGYFDVLGIGLVRGRTFARDEQDVNSQVAIVSESAAGRLWPGRDPLGQVLYIEADPAPDESPSEHRPFLARRLAVVGVARDVPGFRTGGFRLEGAGVYVPMRSDAPGASLILMMRGNTDTARAALVDRMARIDPNMADVRTLQVLATMDKYLMAIPFWLTLGLGALALLLTLSGLFSVLSYLVAQRTREIGVRMALGSTRARIVALILAQIARPVGAGLLIGSGAVAALAAALLATPAAAMIGDTVRLRDPWAYAAGILCIAIACAGAALVPALRAARINPMAAIRLD